MKHIIRLLASQDGVSGIEYAMIASVISIMAVSSMFTIGGQVEGMFSSAASAF